MGFSLRDKFNEATSQLNRNREAQVAQTLRKKQDDEATMNMLRQKANQRLEQQASTGTIPVSRVPGFGVRKPQINQAMAYNQNKANLMFDGDKTQMPKALPNVNLNQGAMAGFRNLFDSNSPVDQINRAREGRAVSYRQSEIDRGNMRPMENIGQQFVGNTARLLNTAGQAINAGTRTNDIQMATKFAEKTGDSRLLEEVLNKQKVLNQQLSSGQGGLLNAGNFLYNNEADLNMSTGEALKRSGLNTVGTASEVLPFKINPMRGARLTTRLVANAVVDAGLGAGESSTRQYLQTGRIDPKTVAVDSVANAVMGTVPTVGGSMRKPITTSLVNAGKAYNKATALPNNINLSDNMLNTLSDFADYKTGRYKPNGQEINNLTRQARAVARAGGVDVVSGSPVEIDGRVARFIEDYKMSQNARPQVGAVGRDVRVKPVVAPSGLKVADNYVNDYAKMLKESDSGKGGQMIETPDGYKRVSEHSPFYSEFYAKNKRAPSQQDWIAESKRQIESGEVSADFYDYVAKDTEALGNNLVNKPSTRMSVAEKESLFSEVPQGTDRQIKVRTPNDKKTIKVNKLVAKNEELPTIDTRKVSNTDKAFRSTRSVIERQGEKGKELAGGLQKARDTQELYLADLQKQMPSVTKLASKGKNALVNKDFENFVDATQGLAKPKNELVAKAIQEWKATHPSIRQRAVDSGLEVGDLGENYYPHFIDYDEVFKNKNTYNQSLNHLVKTGQAKNVEEAIKLLGYARDVSRNRQFGNLEASRLIDLPFYDKTPNSFISYLNGSTKRIAQTETFGKGDEKALKMIADAGQEGYDTEAMKNAYDVAVGAKLYNPTTSKITGGIRKYVTTTRLGLGALTNVSQNVNTGIVTGHLRTLKAMAKQLDPKVREYARDTGVISDALLNDLKTQQGYSSFTSKVLGKGINKITAPFFGTVEKFNRAVSATAGRDYALRLAQKGDEKTLRKLGVTGKIGKELTEAQQIQASRKIVEKTQFKVDPQDLPGWADSPGGKLVAQFRTFSYNQGKFVSNEILKPASKGNLLPLGRLMASLPVGYGLYEARRVIDGRPEEEDKTKIGLASFQKVGGAGLVLDMYQALNPLGSKYIPSDRRASMAVGAFGGPAVGIAVQGVGAISEAIQRKNTPKDESRLDGKLVVANSGEDYTDLTQLARFGLSQVPAVGTPIKNRLLPYKKESEADTGKTESARPKGQVAVTDKSEKDSSGDYTSRDKYDSILNAYEKSDGELKNIQKYDNAELKKAISDVKSEIDNELKTLGLPAVKSDSKLAREYASYKKSDSDDALNSFLRETYKANPPKKEAREEMKKWLGADVPEPNDEIANSWIDYKLKMKDGEYSEIDARNKRKELVTDTFKSGLSNIEKDLYSVSEEDLEAYVEDGSVTEESIAKALEVEKQLFDAGLIEKETLARKWTGNARGYKSAKTSGRGGKGKKLDFKMFAYGNPATSLNSKLQSLLEQAKVG